MKFLSITPSQPPWLCCTYNLQNRSGSGESHNLLLASVASPDLLCGGAGPPSLPHLHSLGSSNMMEATLPTIAHTPPISTVAFHNTVSNANISASIQCTTFCQTTSTLQTAARYEAWSRGSLIHLTRPSTRGPHLCTLAPLQTRLKDIIQTLISHLAAVDTCLIWTKTEALNLCQ